MSAERFRQAPERADRHSVELTTIDCGHERPRDAGLLGNVLLAHTQADAQRTELAAQPKTVHARIPTRVLHRR